MPNGDPDWGTKQYPKLEAFFAKIAPVLKAFTEKHNLKIQKYYHEAPDWDLQFKHPKGGMAQITVRRDGEDHVRIAASWQLNDYDTYPAFQKYSDFSRCTLQPQELSPCLTEALKTVLSWDRSALSGKPDETYKRLWHNQWTKDEFERLYDEYPVAKFD